MVVYNCPKEPEVIPEPEPGFFEAIGIDSETAVWAGLTGLGTGLGFVFAGGLAGGAALAGVAGYLIYDNYYGAGATE